MIDSFHEQGEISNWYFKRMKKKLKKYDEIYQLETEKEEKTENEEKPKIPRKRTTTKKATAVKKETANEEEK